MSQNDENTQSAIFAVTDQVATLFAHFYSDHATWDNFTHGSSDLYLERLKLGLDQLSMCIEAELLTRGQVEPTDLGI